MEEEEEEEEEFFNHYKNDLKKNGHRNLAFFDHTAYEFQ